MSETDKPCIFISYSEGIAIQVNSPLRCCNYTSINLVQLLPLSLVYMQVVWLCKLFHMRGNASPGAIAWQHIRSHHMSGRHRKWWISFLYKVSNFVFQIWKQWRFVSNSTVMITSQTRERHAKVITKTWRISSVYYPIYSLFLSFSFKSSIIHPLLMWVNNYGSVKCLNSIN